MILHQSRNCGEYEALILVFDIVLFIFIIIVVVSGFLSSQAVRTRVVVLIQISKKTCGFSKTRSPDLNCLRGKLGLGLGCEFIHQ